MITKISNLLLNSSKSMSVDGSSIPQTFIYTAEQTVAVLGISVILENNGTSTFKKFGSITALSNGINIRSTIASVDHNLITIKDNADLCTRFYYNQFGSSAVLSVLGVSTPQGFGNTNDAFIGYMDLMASPDYFILNSGDSIQAIVQDNLTSVDLLEMAVKIGVPI